MFDNVTDMVKVVWEALPQPVKAGSMAFTIALLRIIYDNKESRAARIVLESALCGAIALATSTLLEAIGLAPGYSTFAGGAIGLVGADQVRAWAKKFAAIQLGNAVKEHKE